MSEPIDAKYLPPPMPGSGRKASEGEVRHDVRAMLASEWVRDRLLTISTSSPRARQAALGPSEIGQVCPRRLAYRIAGTPIVNFPDPLKAMFGTGMHAIIAAGLTQLDNGVGRYLIEHRVSYRGIAGSVDLHDRYTKRTTDWKTTALNRIRQYQRDGVSPNYVVQAQIYAQGLLAQGEEVETIALTFIPRDGTLTDVWTWTTTPNADVADRAIDRYEELRAQIEAQGDVAAIPATPTNLCGYCPNHRTTATDLSVACPGKRTT